MNRGDGYLRIEVPMMLFTVAMHSPLDVLRSVVAQAHHAAADLNTTVVAGPFTEKDENGDKVFNEDSDTVRFVFYCKKNRINGER